MKIWIFLVMVLFMAACASKPQQAADEAATPVEVAPVESGSMKIVISAQAIVYAVNQATIVPKISAPVRRFLVQRGDHVKQGQLLAILEDGDLQASATESRELYRQAQANLDMTQSASMPDDLAKSKNDLAAAREGLEAARKVYQNRVALLKEGALAQKLVDDAKVALVQAQSQFDTAQQHLTSLQNAGQPALLKSSQAQVSAAKAHYESSAAQSSYGEVRSPIAGVVADRGVNVGDVATSGAALFSIVDISRIVARANVPVNEAALLKAGQSAVIHGPEGDLEGKVTVVSPSVDANTTTVQVWVEAANKGEQLKLGSTVTVNVQAGIVNHAVMVPVSALLASDDGGEKVMVAKADGSAQERKVETGVRDGDRVQIRSGVKPGENVIVRGGLGLDDKAKIEISRQAAK